MGIRRGAAYLESLRDGREVWLRGERVDPVTHPSLAGCANTFASIFDLHHDPAYQDGLTMPSPSTGDRVSIGYLLPHSYEDLVRRREAMEILLRRTGGMLGRLPPHPAAIVMGMYDARATFAEQDPAFADHITAYYELCREQDLAVALAFVDPLRDRERPDTESRAFRVVAERPDGIVVRGVKGVATMAPYADDLLVLTLPGRELRPDEVVYFACPINSPGLRVICREPLAPRYPEDHPASARFDEMDTWVVFDDVFVPHERIFYRWRGDLLGGLQARMFAWAYHYAVVRLAVKGEVLLGLASAIAEHLGTTREPQVEAALADAICYVELLRSIAHEAERNAVRTDSGLLVPNPTQVSVGRVFAVEREPDLLHSLRELCGAGLLMAPGAADLACPAILPDVERYLIADDSRAEARFHLLQLAWDYVADSFAARQLLFDMFNARETHTNKRTLARDYDASPMAALAQQLADPAVAAPLFGAGSH